MGTEIHLSVSHISLTFSKNHKGMGHSSLFLESDRQRRRCDQIDYEVFEENGDDPSLYEWCFVKSLRSVIPRVELLGFTLNHARNEYDLVIEKFLETYFSDPEDKESKPELMTFDEFIDLISKFPLKSLDNTFYSSAEDITAMHANSALIKSAVADRLPLLNEGFIYGYSETSYFSGLLEFLDPYTIIRLLGVCEDNLDEELIWDYGGLVQNGWAEDSDFPSGLNRTETFLIATEGPSDVHILKHAFSLLRPQIADFFKFIDVSESHPFPGTGNLVKFADGLVKIDIQNNIIFVLDNDAEGMEAFKKIEKLKFPNNMEAMLLPDLDLFKSFPSRGPQGDFIADINGGAAAIECYLDLNLPNYPPPKVIWTNYKKDLDRYHGALEYKESYTKAFLKISSDDLANYDMSKLECLLNKLIRLAQKIAEGNLA